jgi:eukaryotic-like serine/threonine-protein kinase
MNQELGQSLNKRCVRCGEIFDRSFLECPVDGIPLSQILSPGELLFGPYAYISLIGAGGMGIIYKARHTILDRIVAVKMLRPSRLTSEEIQRFQKEGKAISKLHHHGIIAVHDLGITGEGIPYMVMDFVDGISLKELIEKRGALSLTETVEIGLQICDAMQHAHANGIIHRDLKPSNIMLKQNDSSYEVKVVDFGIAKIDQNECAGESTLTKTGQVFGSPAYMSPEQARGLKVEGSSDIYSVGCILFECLTGAAPFQGETVFDVLVQHIHGQPPSLTEASLGAKFPVGFAGMITKALQKDPNDRFSDFADFRDTLLGLAAGHFVAPLEQISGASKNRLRRAISLFAITLILVGTAAVWTFRFFSALPADTIDVSRKSRPAPTSILPDDIAVITSLAAVQGLINDAMLSSDRMLEVGDINFTTDCLEEIAKHKMLLGISFRHARTIDDRVFKYIQDIPLRHLDLCDTQVTDAGLASAGKMKTLESLNLSQLNRPLAQGLKRRISYQGLEQLAKLPHLRKLELESDYLTDRDLKALTLFPHLTELDLSSPQCCSLKFLDYVGGLQDLTTLQIEGLQITLPQLVTMKNFRHLRSLNLRKNHVIRSDDADAFFRLGDHLEFLSVEKTNVDGGFVRKLFQFNELGQLNLRKCSQVKRQDVLFLRKVLPGCVIESDYEL